MPQSRGPHTSKRITISDVAEAAGVSKSTASRALTGNGYAAESVRKRVQTAARKLHYVPDANARQLRQQTSKAIGVIVSHLRNSFYADLAAGAAQEARNSGYVMLLADDDSALSAGNAMLEMRVAGVILTPSSGETTDLLLAHNIPVVEVDRIFATNRCDSVVLDNHTSASNATRDLLQRGHRRIALLLDESDWTTGRDRLAGFKAAYASEGIDFNEAEVVSAGWSMDEARDTVSKLLKEKNPPTAIFAANNVLAEGTYRAIQNAGLQIPRDISLVSFDDAPWMSMVSPGITAVAQDATALGAAAIQRLVARLKAPNQPFQSIVLSAEVEARGSVGSIKSR